MKNKEVIKFLCENNDKNYQLIKACEEFSELTTALIQFHTKKGRKTTADDVIKEIADAKIRLKVMEDAFGPKSVKKAYNNKLSKFAKYIKNDLYKGNI